ncbi:MAG: hypothetical protein HFG83_11355 [Dorea sp.]|jgi:hypothetical protein|nr:hypothetical protein [Dorea sp.]
MDAVYTMDEVAKLAPKCILLGNEKRSELEWVRKRYEWIQEKYNLKNKIPRKVFIRHLLILGLPELTLEKLDGQLQFFGYLGLDELP